MQENKESRHQAKCMFFVEHLTAIVALFYLWPYLFKRPHRHPIVYYIEASRPGIFFAQMILRFFSTELQKLDFRLIDIRDEQGNLIRLQIIYRDLAQVQDEILKDPSLKPILESIKTRKSKLYTFLIKQSIGIPWPAPGSLFMLLYLTHVILWKKNRENPEAELLFFADRRLWQAQAAEYARRHQVALIPVFRVRLNFKDLLICIFGKNRLRAAYQSLSVWNSLFRPIKNIKQVSKGKAKESLAPSSRLITEYCGQLNLDRAECFSELFFCQNKGIRGEDILLIFNSRKDPLDEKKFQELQKYKIIPVVLSSKASKVSRVPVFSYVPKNLQTPTIIQNEFSNEESQVGHQWLRHQLSNYYEDYAYWADLFSAYNAKVYVSWCKYDSMHCVMADALEKAGGVTAIYQRAVEVLPSPETTIAADIVFGFSKKGADIEKLARSVIPYFVVTGYFNDCRFDGLKKDAKIIREGLQRHGAKKIISYFDESSGFDPRWQTGNEFMRINYEFLLNKVLENPWVGLVLKPKHPHTLEQRLGKTANLLKDAEKTGRCHVIRGGIIHSHYPPALAALASDLAIHGHLFAATAGLESALAGIPTLLLDREGWPMSSFYNLGAGRVVFNDWEHLWKMCKEHWDSMTGVPGFGDWSPMLEELDPFRDGRAAERITTYLQWILDGFKNKLSRDTVLADAAQKYSEQWGKDKVMAVNSQN